MNEHLLAADRLFSGYDKQTILHDISISVPQNKISVILGANGCGKSTLLKTFARLLKPSKGTITLDGKHISSLPSRQLHRLSVFFPRRRLPLRVSRLQIWFPEGVSLIAGPSAD